MPPLQYPDERWRELGRKLRRRRADLGYRSRREFCDRPGALSLPMIVSLENGKRTNYEVPNTFIRAEQMYGLPEGAIEAVLSGTAGELVPATPADKRRLALMLLEEAARDDLRAAAG